MAKNIDYYASVTSGTSRVIGGSENDWGTVRPGSYIKFQNDPTYFTISDKKEYFYISEFESENGRILTVKENFGINLLVNDLVTITYKEQELLNISKVIEPGKGYVVGDELEALGGEQSLDVSCNGRTPAIFKVKEIGEAGGIKVLDIIERGKYVEAPKKEITLIHGRGSDAKIKVDWTESPKRSYVEKEIEKTDISNDKFSITLNYQLPDGIKKGKLSVKKWEIFLASPYNCVSKDQEICNITRDFTPNYKLPLMSSNQHPWLLNQEVAHNEAVSKMDLLIKRLDERIKKLEG